MKGQEAQEEKEPCCEAGRRLRLRSAAVPGTAGSRPLPAPHRARDALLGQFRRERVPPPPASPAGHSCPHKGGFNLPQKPASSKATPSRTEESWARPAGTDVWQVSGGFAYLWMIPKAL